MRFWDSSALVPLVVEEELSPTVRRFLADDDTLIAWWGSQVECASAIACLERNGALDFRSTSQALRRLKLLQRAWNEVEPGDIVRDTATRLLRVHDLRAADALQLAAALLASEGQPASLSFVCLDERLAKAASREGFDVVDRSRMQPPDE